MSIVEEQGTADGPEPSTRGRAADWRRFPRPPRRVVAARRELVENYFGLDDARRATILAELTAYARLIRPLDRDRRATKRHDWRKTADLAAEHCYGCPTRVLLGDFENDERLSVSNRWTRRRGWRR